MGFRLFIHAFKTIFRNFRQALTISIIPFAVFLGVTLLFGRSLAFDDVSVPSFGQIMGVLVVIVAMLFVFGFVAAAWHRFVLLDEKPQFFGGPAMGRAFPYIRNYILLGLWLMLFLIPVMIVVGVVAAPFVGPDGAIGTGAVDYGLDDVLFEIVIGTLVGTIVMTYSLVLPASALNTSMTFKESRLATKKLGIDLVLVTFCVVMFNILANYVLFVLLSGSVDVVYDVLSVTVQWLSWMIGISILTTLYGHLVEGRDLPV